MTTRLDAARTRSRTRNAYRGIRGGPVPTAGVAGPGDRAVLDLVADPFVSVADAHDRLTALEALFRDRGDARGAFLVVYARVTAEVGREMDAGEFADPDWVRAYLVAFADRYRRALAAYERGDAAALPDPWQVAFGAAERGDCLIAQATVLGINAHVNYDLALTLHEVGVGPDRRTRYADHRAVNAVLRRLVDDVQDRLAAAYAPGLADVDERLGRVDEWLGYRALAEGRDSAWRSAVALGSRVPARRRLARWWLGLTATGAAYAILAPTAAPGALESLDGYERPGAGRDRREDA
jgi:hypothetical protein